ncbi:MAG: hypothetical protein U0167_10525 [bacterium]
MKARWKAAVVVTALGILSSSGGASGISSPGREVPSGGRNLQGCLLGIQACSLGRNTGDGLLEIAGGVLAYFSCR